MQVLPAAFNFKTFFQILEHWTIKPTIPVTKVLKALTIEKDIVLVGKVSISVCQNHL